MSFWIDSKFYLYYTFIEIRKSRDWYHFTLCESEVMLMLEEMILQLLLLSLIANLILSTLSLILIVALSIIKCKENHTSADR